MVCSSYYTKHIWSSITLSFVSRRYGVKLNRDAVVEQSHSKGVNCSKALEGLRQSQTTHTGPLFEGLRQFCG